MFVWDMDDFFFEKHRYNACLTGDWDGRLACDSQIYALTLSSIFWRGIRGEIRVPSSLVPHLYPSFMSPNRTPSAPRNAAAGVLAVLGKRIYLALRFNWVSPCVPVDLVWLL